VLLAAGARPIGGMLGWKLLWQALALHAGLLLFCGVAHHVLPGPVEPHCAGVCTRLHVLLALAAERWPLTLLPDAVWLRANGGALFNPQPLHAAAIAAAVEAHRPYFEGWYYKAVLGGGRSLVLIPGLLTAEPSHSTGSEEGVTPGHGDGFGFVMVFDSSSHASKRTRLYRYPLAASGSRRPRLGEGSWAFAVGPNRFSAMGATLRLSGSEYQPFATPACCATSHVLTSPVGTGGWLVSRQRVELCTGRGCGAGGTALLLGLGPGAVWCRGW
jgi:hypothetical protein